MSYGLLALRLVIGSTLAAHGAQKLFGLFGGPGRRGTEQFFGGLGFRASALMALAAGASEFGGGTLFALGFVTPAAAFLIAVVMLVAIATVHWPNGFFAANGGFEFNLALLAVVIGVTATGPGRFSLDRAAGWDGRITGLWWAVGVLVLAAVAAWITVALFRAAPAPGSAAFGRLVHRSNHRRPRHA
jgi:putative oxidoreductase